MKTNHLMKKKNFHVFYKVLLNTVFSFKIDFFFSFSSDFNLEATVVKTGEIRRLKQLFTPYFLLIEEKSKIIITA